MAFDVTVCVPTYQGAAYLDECLASVAAQDLGHTEVLVVDDGSTDATVAIARSYAGRIEHLRVVHDVGRLGAVANLNRCVELAEGRWIKPVFQDDTVEPGCLAAMRAARRPGVPAVVCARRYRYEDGVPPWRRDACEHLLAQSLDRRFGGGYVAGHRVADVAVETAANRVPQLNFVGEPVTFLLDRRAVRAAGGFDTGYAQLWDYELVVRLAVGRGVVVVDEPLASFRVHEGSETARNFAGSAFETNVLDRLRLHVAYATGWRYRPVRAAARARPEPVDLTALAVGVADAARHLVEELPAHEREPMRRAVERLARPLPRSFPVDWAGEGAAVDAATALFVEFTGDPSVFEPGVPPVPVVRRRRTTSRAARALRTGTWRARLGR